MQHPVLEEIVKSDPRFAYEAYEFVFAALAHTQKMLDKVPPPDATGEEEFHVSGKQLLEGVKDLALREFGLMARTVFRVWGINKTGDFGEMVFNLVEANLMSKTARDQREDFKDIFDLDKVLEKDYNIKLTEEEDAS